MHMFILLFHASSPDEKEKYGSIFLHLVTCLLVEVVYPYLSDNPNDMHINHHQCIIFKALF